MAKVKNTKKAIISLSKKIQAAVLKLKAMRNELSELKAAEKDAKVTTTIQTVKAKKSPRKKTTVKATSKSRFIAK